MLASVDIVPPGGSYLTVVILGATVAILLILDLIRQIRAVNEKYRRQREEG